MPETKIPVRRRRAPDADLYLRSGAAAITSVGGDRTSPDWESSVLDIGPGQYVGAIEIVNGAVAAAALTANADNTIEILVIGLNDAEDEERTLASFLFGSNEVLPDTDNLDFTEGPISIMFTNAIGQTIYPKIKLAVVTDGTATNFSVNFDAFVSRGPLS